MKVMHFETLRPVCPVCREQKQKNSLGISVIEIERNEDIIAGILGCDSCGLEYPIIDGMPIIVPNLRHFVQQNLFYLLARNDLPHNVETLLGDAAGPDSAFESIRRHVSSYMWDHWGDLKPESPVLSLNLPKPGSILSLMEEGLHLTGTDLPEGPILDIGCGAGRTVHELARQTGRLTLGIDTSVPLARAGRSVLTTGRVDYSLRRTGLVYDRQQYDTKREGGHLADIWLCDALALPFSEQTFSLVNALNVVDCMASPKTGLEEISRILKPNGKAIVATPFDWSAQVTPPESWIGGHSQRAPHAGLPEPILEMLLGDGPLSVSGLERCGVSKDIPWHVRLHDRSWVSYITHLVATRKISEHRQSE